MLAIYVERIFKKSDSIIKINTVEIIKKNIMFKLVILIYEYNG
jgi:hypothetical protein